MSVHLINLLRKKCLVTMRGLVEREVKGNVFIEKDDKCVM